MLYNVECCRMFSGVKLSMGSFVLFWGLYNGVLNTKKTFLPFSPSVYLALKFALLYCTSLTVTLS